MSKPKYEYMLFTWGGFYDIEKNHKSGRHYFDTKEGRDEYLAELLAAGKAVNLAPAYLECEGYNVREITTLHRVSRFNGEEVYTKFEMNCEFDYDTALYHINEKWALGLRDFPFGDIDYTEVETVQEWITGAFKLEDLK